jgi:hypothetical protein
MHYMRKPLTLRQLDWYLRYWGGLALQSYAWVGVWACGTQSSEADGRGC